MQVNIDELNRKGFLNNLMTDKVECVVCGGHSWKVEGTVMEMPEFNPPPGAEHKVYPVLIVACDECGYIVPFAAGKVGGVKFLEAARSGEASDGQRTENG